MSKQPTKNEVIQALKQLVDRISGYDAEGNNLGSISGNPYLISEVKAANLALARLQNNSRLTTWIDYDRTRPV